VGDSNAVGEDGGMGNDTDAETAAVRERYARFARDEAPDRSELYADWATGVARDSEIARILARIPATRRQPPLVFAVTRMLGAPEVPFAAWSAWLREHADEVVAEASRRRLQTNEPQRCAALLPALATIDGPIALLELGASGGLCLYPDRYSYRYRATGGMTALDPADGPSTVVLECDVYGDPPLRMPHVVWRAGIDLDPLDAADAGDRRFLTSLVWPGESGRADRFEVQLLVYSMKEKRHARIKAYTADKLPAVTPVFEGAHNYEREAFDLFGVVFEGHPSLTRIMLPDGWVGHPLRRDAVQPVEPVDFTVTRDLYNT
jgi:hypothetical protein